MIFTIQIMVRVLLLVTLWCSAKSQILDTSYPMIFEDPQITIPPLAQRKSYFGYSVVLYSGSNTTWIQIGAPRANCTAQEGIFEPGRVYRCGLPGPCYYLPIETSGNERTSDYYDLKDGGWLGGSQAVHQIGDQVAVCAPRWKDQRRKTEWGMEGACYTAKASDVPGESWFKYLPLLGHEQYAHPTWKDRNVHDYFLGQAGISINYPQDQVFRNKPFVQLVLGAPGVLNWRGSAVLMTQRASDPEGVSKREAPFFNTGSMDSGSYDTGIVPHMIGFKEIYDADYFGYSVTSGRFFSRTELLHVASAPRGNSYRGNVIVFEFPFETRFPPRVRFTLRGTEVGGYFGASLAAADLNGDHLDDLIVTAPHQAKPRVYLFLGSYKRSLAAPQNGPQYLEAGPQLGDDSQFGAAVATADLDQDGYNDILVGAPGAGSEGSGALVVFRGGPQGMDSEKPSQVVFATDITPKLHIVGFGSSISPPVDVDNNNYPDVAIGAYLSGHVVFLRTRANAQLSAWVTGPEQLQRNTTSFIIKVCMLYSPLRHKVKPTIVVDRTLSVDRVQRRAFFELDPSTSVHVHKRIIQLFKQSCEELTIKVKKDLQDFFDPLEITVNVTVYANNNASDPIIIRGDNIKDVQGFDKDQPVAAPADSILSLPFATECGDDGICDADLRIQASFPEIGSSGFILGSSDSVRLQIQLWNEGEAAYLVRVIVKIPPPAAAAKIPPACQVEATQHLLCNIDLALHQNLNKTISLDIDMRSVKGNELQFLVEAITKSVEVSPENNVVNVTLPLLVDARLQIAGKSMKDAYSYLGSDDPHPEELVQFEHIFEIQKFGDSAVDDVMISVMIPHKYSLGSRQFTFTHIHQPEGFQSGQPFSCQDTDLVYYTDADTGNEVTENTTINEEVIKRAGRSRRDVYDETNVPTVVSNEDVLRTLVVVENGTNPTVIKQNDNDGILKLDEGTKELPENRTIRITCEAAGIVCHELRCLVGPFRKSQTVAKLLITMKLNVSILRGTIMGDKDIIVFQSRGLAEATGSSTEGVINGELATVNSVFLSKPPDSHVDAWVIAMSLIVGMLILLFIAMGLVKAGFFQRKIKAELEALKEAAATQQSEDPDAEWVEDVTKDNEVDISLET